MKKQLLIALAPCLALGVARADLQAFRVGRAETVSKGVIEHAVIFVEDGKIVTIGEDLPIERGIPVVDKPEWTVIPGLVDCYTRIGADSEGGEDMSPDVKASDELWPGADEYEEIVKYGETTLGIYPAGNGIPGQAVAVRTKASTSEDMVLKDPAYLKIILRADTSSKKRIKDGFKKADDYDDKVKKAREKWDKDQEKKKGKKDDTKKDDAKKDEKKEDKPDEKKGMFDDEKPDEKKDEAKAAKDAFVPPAPDAKTKPFVDLRAKSLRALVSINAAADYLHWLDALGKEDILWDLRINLGRPNSETDLFYVTTKKAYELDADGIGDKKVRVVIEPVLNLTPGTMVQRNMALELSNAGAKVVFIPRDDNLISHKNWLGNVGEMVGAGLKRDVALRAMTLEPAELMGVADRVGSLEKGKDANMVFLNGDPFEPSTRIQAVMLEGKLVFGEVNQ
jgi:imidazolonepropionase-like amidohydrolase